MRLLKLAGISIILLFLVVTGISLLIPSNVRISRAININGTPAGIMARIGDENNLRWYPGFDSVSATYMGEGTLELFTADPSPRAAYFNMVRSDSTEVAAELAIGKMKPLLNVWNAISHPGTDSVTVQWYIDFHLRWYPWEKFASLFFDQSYGPVMEKGLTNLKNLVEN